MLWLIRIIEKLWRLTKRLLWAAAAVAIIVGIATAITVYRSGDPNFQYRAPETLVNDVTRINPVHVARVLRPTTIEQVSAALRDSTGPVSIGGGRFSQGGQIAYPNSLHLDMRSFNKVVDFDADQKRVTVQTGITWRELQQFIDEHDLAVRIMQTYSNFTVGGSLSVNVHGRYIGEGPVVRSVESIRMVLSDGSVVTASPTQYPQLFYGAIGGYGGLGVIVEATLLLAANTRVERVATRMKLDDYPQHFRDKVRDNPRVVFHNADLYPPDYDELLDVSWYETAKPLTKHARLRPTDKEYVWQPRAAALVASVPFGAGLREHVIDPFVYSKDLVAWRNWEASYDVAELEPKSRDKHTYVLREYFVPVDQLQKFVPRMRDIFNKHDANILNVSIRHALPDPGTLLAWAREEVFALVVYYRQRTDRPARDAVRAWSRDMIDAVIDVGGTYYLPYQVYATPQQFRAAYPRADEFFALKDQVDPANRFRNALWEQHYPANRDPLDEARESIATYERGEEQTFLTVPEWYLVFNPLEYAEFLEGGNDPNEFPFLDSIDEYWTLYDRVREIVDVEDYPPNNEYITMLRVIGVSTTAEFLVKAAYEKSMGRLTRWLANGEDTPEDKLIQQAHRAYSNLIFNEAWYKFDFGNWIKRIWTETDFLGEHFVRKLERKLFLTAEFGIKQIYAKLIGMASAAAYGEKAELIYFTAVGDGEMIGPAQRVASVFDNHIISVPRWGPFTETLPRLAAAGYEFVDISGNDRIVVTLVDDGDLSRSAQAGQTSPAQSLPGRTLPGKTLFRSRMVSQPQAQRLVQDVDVGDLRELIVEAGEQGLRIEHIYDY